ncbi:MAG: hypothetical protein IPM71_05395 [Bacteroidota bacterium]|nr:MAG: hypothetical protein IPM71_05395 [Bacteroidota bacterium]
MKPELVLPSKELSKLVVGYLSAINDENSEYFKNLVIPVETVSLVFFLDKSGSILSMNGNIKLPEYFILSPKSNHRIISDTPSELFIVFCRVSAFSAIFKISPTVFSGKRFITTDLFRGYPMLKILKEITPLNERIAFFENFILNNTALRSYKAIITDEFRSDLFFPEYEINQREINHPTQSGNKIFLKNDYLSAGR